MTNLVVVESPAKAKTINKYLGKGYKVVASFGHIRDLPSKVGSVDVENNFKMKYSLSAKNSKAIKALLEAAKGIDKLILATDPDREGEAIAWHVLEVLKSKKIITSKTPVERVVFNAITKHAVDEAMKNPREIDINLVDAQQARRALDYLVGFTLSPVLWRKLPGSRSAGRVQSVALRLISDREDEIEDFKTEEYWTIGVDLKTKEKKSLFANLTHIDGKKLEKFDIKNEKQASEIKTILDKKDYEVVDIEKKQSKRKPYAPFTTSTLQQEASKKLGFSTKKTMNIAQKLYEGKDIGSGTHGLITYMRTDGVYTAPEAIESVRKLILDKYGEKYLPKKAIIYQNKVKNAQEAHEAIRPTDPMIKPEDIKKYLEPDEFKLYDLIWKRLIASQMESVVLDTVSVIIATKSEYGLLRASGSVINFDGFYILYNEEKEDENEEEGEKILPKVDKGEVLSLVKVKTEQHFTEPPPRYTEASLVKKMEELGIGRPSTYATIISVLQDRDYVKLEKKKFIPEQRGRIVSAFLKSFFKKYVEYDYTANLEDDLDVISNGKKNWINFLKDFWEPFHKETDDVLKIPLEEVVKKMSDLLLSHFLEKDENGNISKKCPECGTGELILKIGKFGVFIGCSNYPECKYIKNLDIELNGESMEEEQKEKFETRNLGKDSDGKEVYLKKGPYGFYVQLGEDSDKPKPKRATVTKGTDVETINLERALSLLSLPKLLGEHPNGGEVKANIGPYGPYLMYNKKFYSVKNDDILTIKLDKAIEIINQSKK